MALKLKDKKFGKFTEKGKFGDKVGSIINKSGQTQEEWKAANGITQESSPEQIRVALQKTKIGTNNIPNAKDDPFAFDDLPEQGQPGGVGDPMRQASNQASAQGQGLVGSASNDLSSLLGDLSGRSRDLFNQASDSNSSSLQAQQMAQNPEFNQQTQDFFGGRESKRQSEVDRLFGAGSREQELLGKNLANGVADLDNMGVSGSSQSSVISNLLGDFQGRRAAASQQAGELSRGEQVSERDNIRATGLNLTGLRSGEGTNRQQIGSGLLGQRGQVGIGLGGLGSDLQKVGLGGMDAALTQEGSAREREASLQQGERAQNINEQQQFIDNNRIEIQKKRDKELQDNLQRKAGFL